VAILLAAGVALYGLFLAIVGVPGAVIREVSITEVPEKVQESLLFSPAPQGLVALLSAAMLMSGLLMRRLTIAWLGLVILLVFSMLFLFGVGGGFLPIGGLLLLLLSVVTALRGTRTKSPPNNV
jgi:hypothetical protein